MGTMPTLPAGANIDPTGTLYDGGRSMDPNARLSVICFGTLGLVDDRMQTQMDELQAKNVQATRLREVVNALNDLLAAFPTENPQSNDVLALPKNQYLIDALNGKLSAAGITLTLESEGKITRSNVETAITKVTGLMDSNTTIQQNEMFNLQSVFSKRNQIFELLSNTLKKALDTIASIIRNL
ncbi:hypothetical protein [Bordetella sp. 15P40C-2]|uniref:hypothetical protein n=1 Tax=Bordetella sp. 15P40C-2 TaxID=2572246 RepID=UPI001323C7E9|nr:hypothetical protein [Bordetella sp. 15P40C-2]MVW70488.1 hypothetical protein [Bordetella sp. 15P40C-2]